MPYENDALSMVVVVPTGGNDVKKVAENLENFDVAKINERLDQVKLFTIKQQLFFFFGQDALPHGRTGYPKQSGVSPCILN